MKTIFITENQKSAIEESLLLELSRRAIQREIESAIRQHCAWQVRDYLDTPLNDCPNELRMSCDPTGDGQMWRSVANNQTGANKFIDFLRINFLSQFGINHNGGPYFFAPGLARISMGELGFYSFNPNIMRGGDITTLGNMATIISNKPDLIEGLGLDENFNGMSFEELKRTLVPIIKKFKKQEVDALDAMTISNNGHTYEIVAINDAQSYYNQRYPDAESRRFLNSISQYTDWCICGAMGDMEYAQYVSNGGKFYICLRDDYKGVPREQGKNCPLDDYGLSMIAVKVAPDGLPDNVTTRWNHDNGGENNENLWLATQLQKILGINFREIFKPRSREELRQMYIDGAGELNEENTTAAQDQVHGKSRCLTPGLIDGGVGGGIMEETINHIETMYRGYNSKYGEQRNHLLWLTSDLDYAKEYGDTVAEYKIDTTKTRGSIFDICDDDYIEGPSKETCEKLLRQGINSYWFDANDDQSECLCLWSSEPIVSKKIMAEGAEPESDEYGIGFEGGSNLEYGHVTEEMQYMHGATPHKELNDFNPDIQPLIMYKQFKLRLGKNGENLAPGYVFPLYVNTENAQNGEKPSGLKIGKWYKSGEGECWLDTNNNRLYTKGKGYNTDGNTIEKLAYRPGWHLTTTPWGNQRGVNKVIGGKAGTGNNYRNMRDSEVWAKVEICVDVDATERARARSKTPADQCLDKLNDREFYKYKTNGNATDDQAWYIVDTIRIIEILDDDSVDSINDKYYQELLQNNPSKKINSNPEDYTKDNVDDIPYWKMPRANGVRYTKDDLKNMGYEPSLPTALNENSNDVKINRYIKEKFGLTDFQEIRNKVMDIYRVIPYARTRSSKFIMGVARYLLDDNIPRSEYPVLNQILHKLSNDWRCGLDGDFNGMSFDELKAKYADINDNVPVLDYVEKTRNVGNGYTITHIESFEEAKTFCDGEWCISNENNMWDICVGDGEDVYIVENSQMVNDVEEKIHNDKEKWYETFDRMADPDEEDCGTKGSGEAPYDEYGLSRFVVIVSPKISEPYVYSRYNLPNGIDGYFLSRNDLEQLLGGNFEDLFPCIKGKKKELNENTESRGYDFERDMKSIASFMRSKGLNVYPYPKVKLNWEDQDGIFIKTGYYEPESKTIVVFCNGRHPKDILRTYSHEMIHHSQNLDGKDLNFETSEVKDDGRLEKIESEAYVKGNIYFRKWTEHMRAKESLNENIDYETVTAQATDDRFPETLDFGININIDEHDWLDLIFSGEKTIATCGGRSFNEWKKHTGEMIGLVKTTRHPSKDNPSGVLVGYARLASVKQYTDYNFVDDYVNHRIPQNCEDADDRCGLVLVDVHELDDSIKLSHETNTVRPLNYPNSNIDENTELELMGWHGSVADFSRFDESFMSTGEGAQAYGWGTYITACKGTGEHYAHVAANRNMKRSMSNVIAPSFNPYSMLQNILRDVAEGRITNNITKSLGKIIKDVSVLVRVLISLKNGVELQKVTKKISKFIEFYTNNNAAIDEALNIFHNFLNECAKIRNIDDIKRIIGGIFTKTLYQVDIPDDNGENYIPWADSLTEQQYKLFYDLTLQYAQKTSSVRGKRSEYKILAQPTIAGGLAYTDLREAIKRSLPSNADKSTQSVGKLTSKLLYSYGITGVRVPIDLKALNRGLKRRYEGWNYVLFNANDIKIINKSVVNESKLSEDTNPDDVDLSSFNIKKELNPKFWKNDRLDSRIRMRLLDIADDFIEYLGVDWVKPDDIIMTGSLANFNWNKKYSDIDLHILMDFSKVDKRRDFVKQYFDSKKNLWNEEHEGLKIFGFPVELYVQDTSEKHSSTGVYSIDKDKWLAEPEREKLSTAKVNKQYIKQKVAEYIDKIDNLLDIYKKADNDEYKIRKCLEDADVLFGDIKKERSKGLENSNNEISNGNVIFKCLRRLNYIDKLYDLKTNIYDKMNSIM